MTQLSLFPKVRTPKARTPQQQLKRRSPEQLAKSRAYDRAYSARHPGRGKVWLAQHPGYYRERRVRAERLRLLVDLHKQFN